MLHTNNAAVRENLLHGQFGLERETLRITTDGFLSQTPHPFPNNAYIVRDFSENQIEINTGVCDSAEKVVAELAEHDAHVRDVLSALPTPEFLWPFSNPPFIRDWHDIPVAKFEGEDAKKTAYREYLSNRYGRYKMALSGIHFNYSFADSLLHAEFAAREGEMDDAAHGGAEDVADSEGGSINAASCEGASNVATLSSNKATGSNNKAACENFAKFKDEFYIQVTENAVAYGWLMTVLTAASPLMDSSYMEKNVLGQDAFRGLSTPRCSEMGYWNYFTPILNYESAEAYEQSINNYVKRGLISSPSELYYPIRLKPHGSYNNGGLAHDISHIELRMFDLNPLFPQLINTQDVYFGQLFLVWLASLPAAHLSEKDQVQAAQNFKLASHYDLKTVILVMPDGATGNAIELGKDILERVMSFYESVQAGQSTLDCIAFQQSKLADQNNRYANIVRERFANTYMQKGLALARKRCQ